MKILHRWDNNSIFAMRMQTTIVGKEKPGKRLPSREQSPTDNRKDREGYERKHGQRIGGGRAENDSTHTEKNIIEKRTKK